MRKLLKVVAILLITIFLWTSYQYGSVTTIGENAVPAQADVIIVLGAAVWPNGPSPALQARIANAAEVYKAGYAENIILSGGLGLYPPTEAEAMEEVLINIGVDQSVMYLEKESGSTYENIALSKAIMDRQGWETAVIVTDMFHIKRALLVARDNGIAATGSPVKNSVLYTNRLLRVRYTIREVLGITMYYADRVLAVFDIGGRR